MKQTKALHGGQLWQSIKVRLRGTNERTKKRQMQYTLLSDKIIANALCIYSFIHSLEQDEFSYNHHPSFAYRTACKDEHIHDTQEQRSGKRLVGAAWILELILKIVCDFVSQSVSQRPTKFVNECCIAYNPQVITATVLTNKSAESNTHHPLITHIILSKEKVQEIREMKSLSTNTDSIRYKTNRRIWIQDRSTGIITSRTPALIISPTKRVTLGTTIITTWAHLRTGNTVAKDRMLYLHSTRRASIQIRVKNMRNAAITTKWLSQPTEP